ncbi:MAG: hypothetical protein HUJ31_17600 [Pseudomonadales bacterium]|nr:hypothetical protein [Pseudomonadales bacterium]
MRQLGPILLLAALALPVHAVVPASPTEWREQFSQFIACRTHHDHRDGESPVDHWHAAPERAALGEFAVRCSAETLPVFIQAPHGFSDLETDGVARALFAQGKFAALAINGVPRYEGDQAHIDNASFQLAAGAFYKQTRGVVVQLHGFSPKKRRDPAARVADLIISNGTRKSTVATRKIAGCMKEIFPNVLVYPDDTSELGGTTNTVGHHLQSHGHDNFYHLEFSYEARQQLVEDESRVKHLGNCLASIGQADIRPVAAAE